jgi:hypothetical protein
MVTVACHGKKGSDSRRADGAPEATATENSSEVSPPKPKPKPEPKPTPAPRSGTDTSQADPAATPTDVDAKTPPGVYTIGARITFQVTFSRAVTVEGLPLLPLQCGTTRMASYEAGSGTDTLLFTHVVEAGESCERVELANELRVDDSRVVDAAGTDADLAFPESLTVAAQGAIEVDTDAPDAPGGLDATPSDGAVRLTWLGDADGFLVIRATDPALAFLPEAGKAYEVGEALAGGASVVGRALVAELLDASVDNATRYTYWVHAFDAALNYSAAVSASALPFPLLWVPDGSVSAMVASGNRLYVGGTFTSFGPYTGGVSTTTLGGAAVGLPADTRVHGTVRASVFSSAGGWVVGGSFAQVGTARRSGLARFSPDGSLQAWAPELDGDVEALAVAGGVLYVAGSFTHANGQARAGLAAFDLATGSLSDYSVAVGGPVHALAVSATRVYFGGSFSDVAGVPRGNLAATDLSGVLDGFDPDADGPVRALALQGEALFAGGEFANVGGAARSFLAALDVADGDAVADFDATADAVVWSLAVAGSTLFAGGDFTAIGGASRARVAALGVADGAATSFDPGANGRVSALAVRSGVVYAGGEFSQWGGVARSRVAAADAAAGGTTSFAPVVDGDVLAVAASSDRVLLGGRFQSAGERVPTANIAAIDLTTGAPATDWVGTTNGSVRSLILDGGRLYGGGDFTTASGVAHSRLAAFSPATGAVLAAWSPSVDGGVRALAVLGGNVYVGGAFSQANGAARSRLAAFDAGGALLPFNYGANGPVKALGIVNDTLFVGGDFDSLGGAARSNIGSIGIDAAPGLTAFSPTIGSSSNSVATIVVAGGQLLAGGSFVQASGLARHGVVSMDPVTGAVDDVAVGIDDASLNDVNLLLPYGSTLFVGGSFSTVASVARPGLVGVEAATGAVAAGTWEDLVGSGVVNAGVMHFGHLIVGGSYTTAGKGLPSRLAAVRLAD